MSPDVPLWNVEQVGTYLNIGKTTVYELVKGGHLKAIKIGRTTRFNPAQVIEWIEQQ